MEYLSSCFISRQDISYCLVGGQLTGENWSGSISFYNEQLPSVSNDNIDNALKKSHVMTIETPTYGCINNVCYSSKMTDLVILGSISGALLSFSLNQIKNKATENNLTKLYQHNSSIEAMDTLGDTTSIISGNDIGQIVIYDIESSTPLLQWCHTKQILDIASRNDNTFCSSSYGGETFFWDNRISKDPSIQLKTKLSHDDDPTVSNISFHQKNDHLVALSMLSNAFRVYDIRSPDKPIINEKGLISKPSFRIAFSPHQEDLIAIGSDDSSVKVFDISNSKIVYKYEKHLDKVRSISWNKEKNEFISGSWDRTVIKHTLDSN